MFEEVDFTEKRNQDMQIRSEQAFYNFAKKYVENDYDYVLNNGTFNHRSGIVHQEILDSIKEYGCDQVIISTIGWSTFDRWLLGSNTEKILRKSQVPVMVVN